MPKRFLIKIVCWKLPFALCLLLTFDFMDHFRNWFLPIRMIRPKKKRQICVCLIIWIPFSHVVLAFIEPIPNLMCACVCFCVIIKLDRYYDLSSQINMSKNITQINSTQQTVTTLDIKRTNAAMVSFQSSNNCQTLKQNSTCLFFFFYWIPLSTKSTGLLINSISELWYIWYRNKLPEPLIGTRHVWTKQK